MKSKILSCDCYSCMQVECTLTDAEVKMILKYKTKRQPHTNVKDFFY